jgi:hypothetical protein
MRPAAPGHALADRPSVDPGEANPDTCAPTNEFPHRVNPDGAGMR